MPALPTIHDSCEVCGLASKLAYGKNAVEIVAESQPMRQVLRRVARIAPTEASVLITGESGTGKEIVARAVHEASSRQGKPFVAINCAALPPDLLESELFGHARGAFTGASGARRGLFEEAHGGTLFLDEIGEMPPQLQAKLLRALQEGEVRRVGENDPHLVDVRVVAATNADLPTEVAEKRFREDLYYRLKVFTLELPPLRDRMADVLPMAHAFLREENPMLRFSPASEAALSAWRWPGNVRELRNAVRHGAVLAEGLLVQPEDLPPEVMRAAGGAYATAPSWVDLPVEAPGPNGAPVPREAQAPAPESPAEVSPLRHGASPPAPTHHLAALGPEAPLDDVVRTHVLAAVEAAGGNRAAAARTLGIGRNTLWRWLKNENG